MSSGQSRPATQGSTNCPHPGRGEGGGEGRGGEGPERATPPSGQVLIKRRAIPLPGQPLALPTLGQRQPRASVAQLMSRPPLRCHGCSMPRIAGHSSESHLGRPPGGGAGMPPVWPAPSNRRWGHEEGGLSLASCPCRDERIEQ